MNHRGRLSDYEIERAKREDDFVGRVSQLVPDLKLKRGELRGTCPEHGGSSFYVVPDKRFAHCFACAKSWDPIKWVMQFEGVGFVEAVRILLGELDGGEIDPEVVAAYERQRELNARQEEADRRKVIAAARVRWREAVPIDGTPAARYLEGRGLAGPFPASLRFHPGLKAKWEIEEGEEVRLRSRSNVPTLLAAVQAPDGSIYTVHRIFLEELDDGSVVKARFLPKDDRKQLYGSPGAGAVRLSGRSEILAVTEGIETGLAVRQALAAGGLFPTVWSTISAGQLLRLEFPADWRPRQVWNFADNDASLTGWDIAVRADGRFHTMGIRSHWRMPAEIGTDWLDVLQKEGSET